MITTRHPFDNEAMFAPANDGYSEVVDRGIRNTSTRYRKLLPGDWIERLIVGLLFAVSTVGIFVLTGAVMTALMVGLLVAAVAVGVVTLL